MNIYFSGIGGVGIGPLAEIAHDAGDTVVGSDMAEGRITQQLTEKGITVSIGQDGYFLEKQHLLHPLDWFVYTSALPDTHPELMKAKQLGIRTAKRDEFLAEFLKSHSLKMIAVAGTHGKTSTTGLAVWAFKQLGIPVSYSVGTTLSFGPSGAYNPDSEYFIYECDEFDRNFLHFTPEISLITSIDYDHPDTYPTEDIYKQAFVQYIKQSGYTIAWKSDLAYSTAPLSMAMTVLDDAEDILTKHDASIAGAHVRKNATLVWNLLSHLSLCSKDVAMAIINDFPGTDRRFERIAPLLYSDYGHHPKEITATLQLAKEVASSVVLVYQPHQNRRQHEIQKDYTDDVFDGADAIYWLPTFLTREDPSQPVLTPQHLTQNLSPKTPVYEAELDDNLATAITTARSNGSLVLCMGAGSIDAWVRQYAQTSSHANNQLPTES